MLLLWAMLLACVTSCSNDTAEAQGFALPQTAATIPLSVIDSVMQQRPDSALALLLDCRDGVHTVSTNPTDRHYYQLLLAEALYKNDSVQRNRKALQGAVSYFDSLMLSDACDASLQGFCRRDTPRVSANRPSIAFLSARAHYINGVGYYENDSAVPACKEYMKALDIMQDHFEEKELVGYKAKFMALTYTHLTVLFSDYYLHEQAICFGHLSMSYHHNYNTTLWHKAWILDEIGSHFEILEQFDSAYCYYQNAITIINDTNALMYRDILTHKIGLVYKMDGLSGSSIPQLQKLVSSAQNDQERSARYLVLGEILYYENLFDSASIYLKKVFDGSTRIGSKKQAAEWLVEISKAQGKESEILEYADFLVPFANQEENNSAIKSQLTELYNTFQQKTLERQHQLKIRKNARWTAVAIGVLLFILLAIAWLYHKNKKKLQYIESQKPEEPAKAQDRLLAFMEEPICQAIVQSVQGQNIKRLATPKAFPELVLTDAQLQQLSMAANRHFVPIEALLEQHGLKAKPALVNLCHLYLLGLDEKQAAILLNRDYSSVKRYEKTLKTAFHTQKSMMTFLRKTVLSQ